MNLRRVAATLLGLSILLLGFPATAGAASGGPQAIVFLVRGVSFEQLMKVPGVRELARAGGAGLLSVTTVPGDRGPGHYLTLGTGVRSAAPSATVPVRVTAPSLGTPVRVPIQPLVEANKGRSSPGLLGSLLPGSECFWRRPPGVGANQTATLDMPAALVTMDRRGRTSFGIGCRLLVIDFRLPPGRLSVGGIGRLAARLGTGRLLIIVAAPQPSSDMVRAKDELAPIVMAELGPRDRTRPSGPMHTLTSDTTRRVGVVSNEDVAPTILDFFHIPIPSEMNGSPIRVVSDAPPPFELHQRHLQNRRETVPVQIGALLAVSLVGFLALGIVVFRRRLPEGIRRVGIVLPLLAAPLAVSLLAVGSLPSLTYAEVIPFLVITPLVVAVSALGFRRFGVLGPVVALGVAILAFFVVEALRGWPDALYPLIGASALDGSRFYGMTNEFIGVLAGAGLWVAAALPAWPGFCLLVGVALFAGLPDLGANLGGALAIFFAAGLWLALRTQRGLLRIVAITALVILLGMAAVLAAHVWLTSSPTHGTRFVEHVGGLSGVIHTAIDRLGIGWRLLLHVPAGWVPVIGLLIELWVLYRPPPVLAAAFRRVPVWRTMVLTLVLTGIVAYVANDSGVAAAGWCFGLAAASLLYLPLDELQRQPAPASRAELEPA